MSIASLAIHKLSEFNGTYIGQVKQLSIFSCFDIYFHSIYRSHNFSCINIYFSCYCSHSLKISVKLDVGISTTYYSVIFTTFKTRA